MVYTRNREIPESILGWISSYSDASIITVEATSILVV
jgi:hypothetical protein